MGGMGGVGALGGAAGIGAPDLALPDDQASAPQAAPPAGLGLAAPNSPL